MGDGSVSPERYVSARALTHFMLATMARTSGDPSGSMSELRLAALYDAEDPYAQCALAREYLRLGQPATALQAIENALLLDPDDATSLAVLGRIHLQRGEAGRAIASLRHAVAAAPEAIEPAALLVDALVAVGEPMAAVAVAGRLADQTEPLPAAERRLAAGALDRAAEAAARAGRSEDAERLYQRALDLEPDRVERLMALARFYELRNRPADAAEPAARAVGLSSARADAALNAARLYLRAGRTLDAAGYITLLEGEPGGSAALDRLAEMLLDSGDRDDALRAYEAAERVAPGWSEPIVRSAALLEDSQRYADAATAWRKVPATDELFDRAQARAAICDILLLDEQGRREDALNKAQSLAASSLIEPDALDFIARATIGAGGDLREAEKAARSAVERSPESGRYLDTLGIVLLALGRSEAFDVLERAAGILPGRAVVQLDLAEAAVAAGHPDAAHAALARADALLRASPAAREMERARALRTTLRAREPAGRDRSDVSEAVP
jgi:tetratricopeptide (TPR) repeat protein